MASRYANLLSEFTIRNCTLRNRIVSTGHHTHLADIAPSPELIAYHEVRAKGGAGLIISEVVAVHDSAGYSGNLLQLGKEAELDAYGSLVEAVHKHGTKIFAQLFHPGREILSSTDGMLPIAWAPSSVPNERFHIMPKSMPISLVEEVVESFGKAATSLSTAGFDGFEIVASHGFLPAQFLNPSTNQRSDRYGGDFENRLRFLKETIASVRNATETKVVGLRISGDEMDDTGLDSDEMLKAAEILAPQLDYISVTAGTSASLSGSIHITPPMGVQHAYTAPFARKIRSETGLPVIATGRINQPQIAEKVIVDGDADLCGMTRALICDPVMPQKLLDNVVDDIRACIGCNQSCIGRAHKGLGVSCIQHPPTGRELEYAKPYPVKQIKKLLIAGGGPAGMKFAATAASRGHEVMLYEAGSQLGGQVLLAQRLPGREEFGGMVDNFRREMELAGVTVELRRPVDGAEIDHEGPDAVVLATGAVPYLPQFEGCDHEKVVSAWDVLAGHVKPGSNVVIADWRADWIGIGLAEMLVRNGSQVTLCTNAALVGETLQIYTRNHYVGRLYRLGVRMHTHLRVFGFDGDCAYFQNTLTGEALEFEDPDNLILSLGTVSDTGLENALEKSGIPFLPIGDCLAPRTAEEAVFEGFKEGWGI